MHNLSVFGFIIICLAFLAILVLMVSAFILITIESFLLAFTLVCLSGLLAYEVMAVIN